MPERAVPEMDFKEACLCNVDRVMRNGETTPIKLTCPVRKAASNMQGLPCSGIES